MIDDQTYTTSTNPVSTTNTPTLSELLVMVDKFKPLPNLSDREFVFAGWIHGVCRDGKLRVSKVLFDAIKAQAKQVEVIQAGGIPNFTGIEINIDESYPRMKKEWKFLDSWAHWPNIYSRLD